MVLLLTTLAYYSFEFISWVYSSLLLLPLTEDSQYFSLGEMMSLYLPYPIFCFLVVFLCFISCPLLILYIWLSQLYLPILASFPLLSFIYLFNFALPILLIWWSACSVLFYSCFALLILWSLIDLELVLLFNCLFMLFIFIMPFLA